MQNGPICRVMAEPDGCLPFAVSGCQKKRFRPVPTLNEADLASAGLGAEAGEGGYQYCIEALPQHSQRAQVYQLLVAWAGYSEQTWENSENLPKVVVDDYWARQQTPEESAGDPDDPPDRAVSLGFISEAELLASLIKDRAEDVTVFQALVIKGASAEGICNKSSAEEKRNEEEEGGAGKFSLIKETVSNETGEASLIQDALRAVYVAQH